VETIPPETNDDSLLRGNALADTVTAAVEKFEAIRDRVCGACEYSCCHTGTMVGRHGIRRAAKGAELKPEVQDALRDAMRARAEELAADLDTIRQVTQLMEVGLAEDMEMELKALQRLTEDWAEFTEFLASDFEFTPENLLRVTAFTAIRANLLRQIGSFAGGHAALARFSGPGGSFQFRRRRLAPPRCMFHHDGCVLGRYKPIKCANFFCNNEPNLLEECQQAMSFDEFVLSNMYVEPFEFTRRVIEQSSVLGRDYWEPFIAVTANDVQGDELASLVHLREGHVEVFKEPDSYFPSTEEVLRTIVATGRENTVLIRAATIGGPALYELAVALQRAHNDGILGGFFLIANGFAPSAFMPHPMWTDRMMSQPLGSLDIFAITGEQGDDSPAE